MSDNFSTGNVYVMTHSFFSDVIRIGCTPKDPKIYANELSKSSPGEYKLVYSLLCDNPCDVKKQVRSYLQAKKYVNEFYEVPINVAKMLVQRESLRIPISTLA